MLQRMQRTISRSTSCSGVGFLAGDDVRLTFHPAPAGHGIVFRRHDLPGRPRIPALIEFSVPRERRTAISCNGATIELVEHVLAALAGQRIDNCLVDLTGTEPPGGDGSSSHFLDALARSRVIELDHPATRVELTEPISIVDDDGSRLDAYPSPSPFLGLTYHLDYGSDSPIAEQCRTIQLVPGAFERELGFSRTFVLEHEATALKAQGYGRRTTAQDLLIFGPNGVVDNSLHVPDECVRHKLLDCVGDFALLGCELTGHVVARRTGHRLNREFVRRVCAQLQIGQPIEKVAA